MPGLVLDQILVLNELDFLITEEDILERFPEWKRLTYASKSHAAYLKGVCEFIGIELMDYDSGTVCRRVSARCYDVRIRSKVWAESQVR